MKLLDRILGRRPKRHYRVGDIAMGAMRRGKTPQPQAVSVDASLPILLAETRDDEQVYVDLARAARTKSGLYSLYLAERCTSWPEVVDGRLVARLKDRAIWADNSVMVDMQLPETVLVAIAGRPAADVIDHPACIGRTIAKAEMLNGRLRVTFEPENVRIADLPGATTHAMRRLERRVAKDRIAEWAEPVIPVVTMAAIGIVLALIVAAIFFLVIPWSAGMPTILDHKTH